MLLAAATGPCHHVLLFARAVWQSFSTCTFPCFLQVTFSIQWEHWVKMRSWLLLPPGTNGTSQLSSSPACAGTTNRCRKLSNLPNFSYTEVPNLSKPPNFPVHLPVWAPPTAPENCPIHPTFPTLAHPAFPNHNICVWPPNLAAHLPNCQQGAQTAGSENVGGLPHQWLPVWHDSTCSPSGLIHISNPTHSQFRLFEWLICLHGHAQIPLTARRGARRISSS